MTGEVASDDHLHFKWLALAADGDVGGGSVHEPVRANIAGSFEHISSDLVKDLAFTGDGAGENDIEGRDTIRGDHNQPLVGNRIYVAYLTAVEICLMRELKLLHTNAKLNFQVHITMCILVIYKAYQRKHAQ